MIWPGCKLFSRQSPPDQIYPSGAFSSDRVNCVNACVLRAPPGSHRPVLRRTPGRTPFPSVCGLTATSFTDPSASRQHLFSVHDHRRQRSGEGRSTLSSLTFARLYIEPSPCGGVRPAGDPVDSDPEAVFEDDPPP